jgi:signal transduction histidine kinase
MQTDKRQADRIAFADETARLALWRMDTQITALLSREAGRPYIAYHAFYPATGALLRDARTIQQGDIIIPSPLLGLQQNDVLLHFQFSPNGELTSPQVPLGNLYTAAVPTIVTSSQVSEATRRLGQFNSRVTISQLHSALQATPAISQETTIARFAFACVALDESSRKGKDGLARQYAIENNLSQSQGLGNPVQTVDPDALAYFNQASDLNRLGSQNKTQDKNTPTPALSSTTASTKNLAQPTALDAEIMRPIWIDDTLLLARRVTIDQQNWLQGCWLDWPTMHAQLLTGIKDLLPDAKLHAVCQAPTTTSTHVLATLPVILDPGTAIPDWQTPPSDNSLLIILLAWGGVLLAVGGGGFLLHGALQLSERRGTFVSAVTHELRTPLTTFRLYTDLLADGHVTNEKERSECLSTLRTEADRLGHLVENVLSYARLERQPIPTTTLGVSTLFNDISPRLRERAERAQLSLVVGLTSAAAPRAVRGEPHAIERILGNLVDNACKYAATASDHRLHLDIDIDGPRLRCTIRDHGPGIPPTIAATLFHPFSKSAASAANSAPGIGLGLALSQRLAQQLGGNLTHVAEKDGAVFVLTLVLVP